MKIKITVIGIVLLLLILASPLFAEYNRDLVVKVMRGNVALLGKLKNNASKRNFFNAAENLMELAKGSKSIENFTPRKGLQSKWKEIHGSLIKAAFQGIGASAEQDIKGLNASISKIVALNREGHSLFR